MPRVPAAIRAHPDAAIAILLVLLALAARLPALGGIAPNITADEADNLQFVLRVLEGRDPSFFGLDWKPGPAFSVHLQSWSVQLFGLNIAALRLPSALLGALTLMPFYLLARRHAGRLAAFAAGVLLSNTLWFVHFSRSGWENVHVAFYGAMAAWMLSLALERRRLIWYGLAGLFAALGLYGYFSGRLIIVALLAYLPFALRGYAGRARDVLIGYALLAAVTLALFAPQLPAILNSWDTFNSRTLAVSVFQQPRPYAGQTTTAGIVLYQVSATLRGFVAMDGTAPTNGRYFPPNRGLFDGFTAILYLSGMFLSFRQLRRTALWWCMFLIPLAATQLFSTGTPDLARAVGVVPFAFLFVALSLERLLRWRGAAAGAVQIAALLAIPVAGYDNLSGYVTWMAQPQTAQVRQPAVAYADLGDWIEGQRSEIRAGRRGFNVGEWLLKSSSSPRPAPTPVPIVLPRVLPERLEAPALPAELVATFGSTPGNAVGQFATPRGVALNAAGDLFVADSGNRRVQRIDKTGRAVVLEARLEDPSDVAVAPSGELYAVDAGLGLVAKFDAQGRFLLNIGSGTGMYRPRGVAVDRAGTVYVADTGHDRILIFDSEGRQRVVDGRDRFKQPTDVAVDPAGNIFVVDPSNRRLLKLDARGELVYQAPISAANTADAPRLALGPDALPVATDPHLNRVVTFDPSGRLSGAFGVRGDGDLGLRNPVGIAVAADLVYVSDAASAVVKVFKLPQ